jgi:phosphoserine aminotransferase
MFLPTYLLETMRIGMGPKTATERIFNFSAGPAVLPEPVLEEAQRDLLALPGCGASVLEISHRGEPFRRILQSAKSGLQRLLNLPDNYRILFLQGGARLQFSMTALNLLRGAKTPAEFVLTGSWGKKALEETRREGPVRIVWDGKATNYDRLPQPDDLRFSPDAAYVYITSNETIQGVQFPREPDTGGAPLVCDASSDFLSRPVPIERYGLIYACAQKNAGPAGVTIVILREDLLERSSDSLPGYLNYRLHAEHDSLYNTPPSFGIYMVALVVRWLEEEVGGLEKMHQRNAAKARLLYDVIDASGGFFRGHAQPECRSLMNVTFRTPSDELDKAFLEQAEREGLGGLKGHRSVGGIRASIYNAMPLAGVQALSDFMKAFLVEHGG